MSSNKLLFILVLAFLFILPFSCSRKIKGTGKSESVGSVSNGSLINGRKCLLKGQIIVSSLKLVMVH